MRGWLFEINDIVNILLKIQLLLLDIHIYIFFVEKYQCILHCKRF